MTALQALDDLARHAGPRRVLVSDVARRLSASPSYLAKVFQALARRGIVRSSRGRNGGYRLARLPADTRIGDVIRALRSDEPSPSAVRADERLRALLRDAESECFRVLDRKTLANLAAPPARRRPPAVEKVRAAEARA